MNLILSDYYMKKKSIHTGNIAIRQTRPKAWDQTTQQTPLPEVSQSNKPCPITDGTDRPYPFIHEKSF
jgi:hypothetical protein